MHETNKKLLFTIPLGLTMGTNVSCPFISSNYSNIFNVGSILLWQLIIKKKYLCVFIKTQKDVAKIIGKVDNNSIYFFIKKSILKKQINI